MDLQQIPHEVYIDALMFNAEQILETIKNDYDGELTISFTTKDGFKQVEDVLMGLNHKPPCFNLRANQRVFAHNEAGTYQCFDAKPTIKDCLANLCDMYLNMVEGSGLKPDGRGVVTLNYVNGLCMSRQVFGRYARQTNHQIEVGVSQSFYILEEDESED